MLTTYFKSPRLLERYQSELASPYLDDFTTWLESRGYGRSCIRRHVREVVHFAIWAKTKGLAIHALNRDALTQLRDHLADHQSLRYPCGAHRHIYQSARVFLCFLEASGVVCLPASNIATPTPADILWCEFSEWMRSQRGTLDATLTNYHSPVAELLNSLGTDTRVFTAKELRQFLLQKAQRSSPEKLKNFATALRMFLRFLISRGDCIPGLDHAIPTVARWRLASLPKSISADDVERLINSCDSTVPLGARDRAILLLLARLGLRSNDVSMLRLSDLEWSDGTLTVAGKNRRETRLPLPQDVGDAILHYLEHGRPRVSSDRVFITITAPLVPVSRQVISRAVRRALRRTNISAPMEGALLLRHSAATNLLRDGASLSAIGVILRHSSVDTTRVYAKVDVGLLNEIVMSWPEVSSC